jgi:hypothetical protein
MKRIVNFAKRVSAISALCAAAARTGQLLVDPTNSVFRCSATFRSGRHKSLRFPQRHPSDHSCLGVFGHPHHRNAADGFFRPKAAAARVLVEKGYFL